MHDNAYRLTQWGLAALRLVPRVLCVLALIGIAYIVTGLAAPAYHWLKPVRQGFPSRPFALGACYYPAETLVDCPYIGNVFLQWADLWGVKEEFEFPAFIRQTKRSGVIGEPCGWWGIGISESLNEGTERD